MIEIPYSTAPHRLKEFLDRIPSLGIPAKLTVKELELRGFRSSNDRSLIRVIKALGLIDEGGTPTEAWRMYRDRSTNRSLLGNLMTTTYADLFYTFPDAHNRSEVELSNFMSTKTGSPASTVQLMVRTFKTLCMMAEFDGVTNATDDPIITPTSDGASLAVHRQMRTVKQDSSLQLQLNLHLHLPDTQDADKIDQIFKSMAKYLLGRDPDNRVDEDM